ncbi:uncharacterized protein LOC130903868 [Diorhabda carinulata]|uniref:uncharacterized protein LOC130903868 n=1 Tax=Diorhabda carinulata TaxID=1163345 RepID=UPI0025A2509D|nr:uncharacterized protein LOC130903868 [Diorhabda carinulata]
MITDYLRLKKSVEVILIIIIAIWILSFDKSPAHVDSNLDEIWKFRFSKEIRKHNMEEFMKYVLSFVVIVRAFTSRVFLILYVIILWPAVFETKSFLIIPWLVIGLVRTIFVNFLTLSAGCYSCFLQKGVHLTCLDFIISQIVDHGPAVYAWFSIYNYYIQISKPKIEKKKTDLLLTGKEFINITPLSKLMGPLRHYEIPTRSLDTLLSLEESVLNFKSRTNCSIPDTTKREVQVREKNNTTRDVISRKDCNVTQSARVFTGISKNSLVEEKELHCLSWDESFVRMNKEKI